MKFDHFRSRKLQDKNEGKLEENLDSLVTALEDAAYNEEHREALAEEMEGSLEGARVLPFRACNFYDFLMFFS